MNYVRHEHIVSDTRDYPDGEIFVVYKKDAETWAFGMKVRGNFTTTKFMDQRVDEEGIKQAKKQIMYCKKYGWAYTGKKQMNSDTWDMEPEFLCMFCGRTTFASNEPCLCRNTTIADMLVKTTKGGLILPY